MAREDRNVKQAFYNTPEWKRCRSYIFKKNNGLCQRCAERGVDNCGELVHHIVPITPENINDLDITLGEDNLMLVCRQCHAELHGYSSLRDGLMFDENGMLIER